MVQHSFQSYSKNPIKVVETDQLLIIYSYRERLTTFLYLGVDAFALTIVALVATLISSIDKILDNIISNFFLKIVSDFDSVAMYFVGFIIYSSLILIFLSKIFKRVRPPLQGYRERFYGSRRAFMLDIIKKRGYVEDSGLVEERIRELTPLEFRIHHLDEIVAMNRWHAVKKYYHEHAMMTTAEYWIFLLVKRDGTAFNPGGWVNQLSDFAEFEELLIRNLELRDIQHLGAHQRSFKDGNRIMYIREGLETQLLNSDDEGLLPLAIKNIDRKPSKFDQFSSRLHSISSPFVLMTLYILYVLMLIVLVSLGFVLLVYMTFNTYQDLFLALAAEDYPRYFLLLIPSTLFFFLYLVGIGYVTSKLM